MKIEDLTKSSYGSTSTTNIPGDPVLFYSYAFYKGKPVGVGVWDYANEKCLSAIILGDDKEKVYLNKIDPNDLRLSGALHELESSFEVFLKE